ncbi:twin-arginine translocase subunit TatC [Methanolobus psychrotolerans]|uniref:twin-arginine translocase subunit TatC n=1 Tax=Methanolobus psychrotolerans TaxID=1874706 RepID=UPI000B91AAEB|nr:twin-arginine translocase subunit TatC [Methanolobus psychrotolerans]
MANFIENAYPLVIEIRKRMIHFLICFFTFTIFSFQIADLPIKRAKIDLLPEGAKIVYISPIEVIMLKIKIALILASILMIPILAYYTLKIILKKQIIKNIPISRFWSVVLVLTSIFMFLLGASYAYFILLPLFIKYLYIDAVSSGAIATYSIFNFVSFVFLATIVFGLIFELPIVLTFLTKSGLIKLCDLIHYRKHIYILFLVSGALVTPPDVISQIMISLPLVLFFEITLIFLRIVHKPTKS